MQQASQPVVPVNASVGGRAQPDSPTGLEMLEEIVDLTAGFATALMPALLLAMPCILLVVVPLVILAVPLALAGAIVALPYLLLRSVRRLRRAGRGGTQSRISAATDRGEGAGHALTSVG